VPKSLPKQDLAAELQKTAENLGLTVTSEASRVGGHVGKISAKWWLGGRIVTYDMSCLISETDHTVHFREAVRKRNWGVPPPAFTIEARMEARHRDSGQQRDLALRSGGGALDYSRARPSIEQAVTAAGWQFELDAACAP
jgi:hypothetical protein